MAGSALPVNVGSGARDAAGVVYDPLSTRSARATQANASAQTSAMKHTLIALTLMVTACTEEQPDAAAEAVDATADSADTTDGTAQDTESDANQTDEEAICQETIGSARVEEVADRLFVAIGFDLANTIVLNTDEGNVVIDVSQSPDRAEQVRAAIEEVAPGPTRAIVYTHSHVDHVGGARVWLDEGTEIWATDAFIPHLIKQYGAFRQAELQRGLRQFGEDVAESVLPCSAIGARNDIGGTLGFGGRFPTQTFSGSASFEVGGVRVELVEAHGETHDQLFVYIPSLNALMPGDNYYHAFPNLYTIRGTSPRPIDEWILSLDVMRGLAAEVLVPSHTRPVLGADEIARRLTDYRDAIQWLRDEVVRGANQLEPLEAMVTRIALPERLADQPYLAERYGQVDWSVRAIYGNALGWFDGRADQLYPPENPLAREIDLMGGADAVLSEARAALAGGDARWAAHLLGKLRDAEVMPVDDLAADLAAAYDVIGLSVANTNGRGYLLQTAAGLVDGFPEAATATLDEPFVDALPVATIFDVMPTTLLPAEARDAHETLTVHLTDLDVDYHVTVRRGIAEVISGDPVPGTPDAVSVITTTSGTWKRLALGTVEPLDAVVAGDLEVSDMVAALRFLGYFEGGF